ncbi:MAG: hypothetical protein WC915_01575 [archaeon]|jgi:hypothetical protein
MMSIVDFLKKLFKKEPITNSSKEMPQNEQIYQETPSKEEIETHIMSIWDVIKCNEHTQAYHLVSVIPYDEWIDMDEIRRRIWDLFQIEYINDRSLYPYLKTMVDLGLIETSNIGGKRKWRKKDLLIKLEEKAKKEEIKVSQPIQTSKA